MKFSDKHITRFQSLWQRDTGKILSRKEAIEHFYKLIDVVKLGIEETIKDK